MLLGKIIGKTTTLRFSFNVTADTKKFEYVQVYHPPYGFVLGQIVELERTEDLMTARCTVLGYKDRNKIASIKVPFRPGSEVLLAEEDFIRDVVLTENKGAYIGKLHDKNIQVRLDLNKLLTKHLAVLAKSGSGKSYFLGVLLEEILEKNIPLLVIDPHGEYSTLKYPTPDTDGLVAFDIEPKGYLRQIKEYTTESLKLSENLTIDELTTMLPKLNTNQMGLLYSALSNVDQFNFTDLTYALQTEESNIKFNLINMIDHLKRSNIFSTAPTPAQDLIKVGQASILNLKGIDPSLAQMIVFKLVKDLFEARKKEQVPPFFLVVEEAHNFVPERSFGSTICGPVLRNVASEGRKFGLGLSVVSQRPARVDKNVLSQCTTQVILKITNPNDIKAVLSSVEGINSESEFEMQNLSIGSALITGIVDMPLIVDIRPRRTQHGGTAVEMFTPQEDSIIDQVQAFEDKEFLPVIRPAYKAKDVMIMHDTDKVTTYLIPCFHCQISDFMVLIDRIQGLIIKDPENREMYPIPHFPDLNQHETTVMQLVITNSFITSKELLDHGMSFSQASLTIQSLISKGLLDMENNRYTPKKNIMIKDNQFYRKPEYIQLAYDQKIEPKLTKEQIIDKLRPLYEVTNIQKCFYVYHEPGPRSKPSDQAQ